ncbi:phosphatase PAP2 family protein [Kiloniella laminariae]|uniref:Phosphatase PAP2 family protein n=1 Tax=Kiloniella laminariae TaxID=454162 RepID=A0ABT4LLE7_9PROT|nr:phosphatase PAP2 family protein [Kiloniella laminariae]
MVVTAFFLLVNHDFKTPWDEAAFLLLNGSLQEGRVIWNNYWAFTNSRIFDSLSAVFLGGCCLFYLVKNRKNSFEERLSRVILIVISVALVMLVIARGFNDYHHPSPSQLVEPFININELVSWIEVKTGTRKSFPSDHAAVSFICFLLMGHLFGRRYGLVLLLFCLVNATPRMVGGGHWFGDVWIGGVLLSLMVYSWAVYTPLLAAIRRLVSRLLKLKIFLRLTQNWQ